MLYWANNLVVLLIFKVVLDYADNVTASEG
jgi:hypothetical protein